MILIAGKQKLFSHQTFQGESENNPELSLPRVNGNIWS
jgi:hypothetical protein